MIKAERTRVPFVKPVEPGQTYTMTTFGDPGGSLKDLKDSLMTSSGKPPTASSSRMNTSVIFTSPTGDVAEYRGVLGNDMASLLRGERLEAMRFNRLGRALRKPTRVGVVLGD